MATVPNSEHAIVESAKVEGYLLSPSHPIGRAKALFFRRFGFREDAPEELSRALLIHVRNNTAVDVETSAHGTKYRVDGLLRHPTAAIRV
jgi:uncharacterized protein DUF6883